MIASRAMLCYNPSRNWTHDSRVGLILPGCACKPCRFRKRSLVKPAFHQGKHTALRIRRATSNCYHPGGRLFWLWLGGAGGTRAPSRPHPSATAHLHANTVASNGHHGSNGYYYFAFNQQPRCRARPFADLHPCRAHIYSGPAHTDPNPDPDPAHTDPDPAHVDPGPADPHVHRRCGTSPYYNISL